MTVEDVIELIEKRRKPHLHSPIGDDTGDPLRWSEGGFHRAIPSHRMHEDRLCLRMAGRIPAGMRGRE